MFLAEYCSLWWSNGFSCWILFLIIRIAVFDIAKDKVSRWYVVEKILEKVEKNKVLRGSNTIYLLTISSIA